ncbi:hypothetical protein IGW14_24265 [Streptomyces hygroscopicus subsp. hygroscopicus]|uniref:Uncharacterized protein n=1 Tax=Streptomyces demainii TaxID=588122 RepID=A0ABT9L895_9ACTN|nr:MULTISPECIES: hypothetical protein [Streptomyces]MBW8091027.1 hypothetical protein [Streptomyces hygroscopicus subsp. hygroscopicus]MDP9615967.1 hypothetical protein [Streptomyces demainii]
MPENTRSGTKARLYDASAASGKVPAGGKRVEPPDLPDLPDQGEHAADALAPAAGLPVDAGDLM